MKEKLNKIFWPILKFFESEDEEYTYEKSHRKILVAVASLFLLLSFGAFFAVIKSSIYGGIIPGVVFLVIGFVCAIVACLGSDHAVAKIWRNR